MEYKEALEKLFSLHQFGIKLGLDNILNLLEHIGNPQKKLKAIHVAGSNGKGSTSSFIASILQEAGYKVALYTSPHFIKFNERIRINGEMIPDDYVVKFINDNINYINSEAPTFFEITTALAFQYFSDKKVDYAVIETGLGGRLDATNVLNSIASVITSISFEHTNILGNDIVTIAKEKAGIIKEKQKVFIGVMPNEAAELFKTICNKRGSELLNIAEYIKQDDKTVELHHNKSKFVINDLPLAGEYQLLNASLGTFVIKELFSEIDDKQIYNGLQNVIDNSGIQGRYERYSEKPNIIFDAAHNIEGIEVFLKEYEKEFQNYRNNYVIYGAMKDKNVEEILKELNQYFDEIYATEINYERAFSINELIELGKKIKVTIKPMQNPNKFIDKFIATKGSDSLVILGSIYVLGEIKKGLFLQNT